MVIDQQVRLLMKLSKTEKTLSLAAAKAGSDICEAAFNGQLSLSSSKLRSRPTEIGVHALSYF